MRKVVLTFGLIGGLIIAVLVWVITGIGCDGDLLNLDYAMFVGYAAMLISLTMVFFGIKSYRDNYAGGQITFWKGVQIGILIALIGGVMYWAGAVSYAVAHPGFVERFTVKFTEHTCNKLRERGAPQSEIDQALADSEQMRKMLGNPVIFFFVCLMEFMPVGIIVTIISAALLRKRELLPAPAV
jgi:Protein of unknown function (DUF4199)